MSKEEIYAVELTFEHSATIFVKATNPEKAQKLAEEIQFSIDHKDSIGYTDGDFGGLLNSSYPEKLNLKSKIKALSTDYLQINENDWAIIARNIIHNFGGNPTVEQMVNEVEIFYNNN